MVAIIVYYCGFHVWENKKKFGWEDHGIHGVGAGGGKLNLII